MPPAADQSDRVFGKITALTPALRASAINRWGKLVDDLCGLLPADEYCPDSATKSLMAVLIDGAVMEFAPERRPPQQ